MSKASVWVAPLATIAILFGTVGVATATGTWQPSGRQEIVAGARMSADDVKGWMTIQQAADGLGLDAHDIVRLIGAPAGVAITGETAFKDIESKVRGFELSSFRATLKDYLARSGGTAPAASASPTAPTASTTVLPAHTPTGTGAGAGSGAGTGTTQSITGQMTLRQVAQAAKLDPAALAKEAGLPAEVNLDVPLKSLKDTVPGFEVQSVRDAVARLA